MKINYLFEVTIHGWRVYTSRVDYQLRELTLHHVEEYGQRGLPQIYKIYTLASQATVTLQQIVTLQQTVTVQQIHVKVFCVVTWQTVVPQRQQ